MRVLMLSMDARIQERGTPTAERIAALAAQAGEVVALVPDGKGSKAGQLLRLWKHAEEILKSSRGNNPTLLLPPPRGGMGRGIDLITVQDTAFVALLAYILARRFNIPLEVQVHGFEKMRGVRKVLARFVLRRADKVRVVSERLKYFLTTPSANRRAGNYQLPTARCYVLPVYAQISTPTPLATRGVLPLRKGGEATFTFLTVGRLVPIKNIALQIHAFARIAKEFPQARLRIVGDGPLREALKKKVKDLKLGDKIFFAGAQSKVGSFYQNADAFLLTSNAEGWGVAVVEAAAHELPIVMTDVGCAGEFIKNNENGIVISVGDEAALVAAMKRVMTDADLRARLSRAARAAFLALPSREEYIQKQITEWRSVIIK